MGHERRSHKPVPGGMLKMVTYKISTLNPVNDLSVYESFIINQLYEGLVELDAGMNPVPGLADFWTINDSFTQFAFRIRPHIPTTRGEFVTAMDVRSSFENLIRIDAARPTAIHHFIAEIVGVDEWLAGETTEISGMIVPDGTHIKFQLKHSTPDFLYFFATDQAKILLTDDAQPGKLMGAGPFTVGTFSDEGMTLLPFKNYFRGSPYLDSIVIHFDDTGLEDSFGQLLNGQVNLIDCPLWGVDSLAKQPGIVVQKRLSLGFEFMGMRVDRPGLDNKNLRNSIARHIDWARLDSVEIPYFMMAQGVIPPGMDGYRPNLKNPFRQPYSQQNPGKLIPAKFSDSLIFGITDSLIAETEESWIFDDFIEYPLPVKSKVLSWTDFDAALTNGSMDFFTLGWVAEIPSTSRYLYNLFHSKGVGNYFGYQNTNVDRLIEKALGATDKAQQTVLCQAIEDSILEDVPLIPLNFVFNAFAYDSHLQGFKLSELGFSTLNCEELWFDNIGADQ